MVRPAGLRHSDRYAPKYRRDYETESRPAAQNQVKAATNLRNTSSPEAATNSNNRRSARNNEVVSKTTNKSRKRKNAKKTQLPNKKRDSPSSRNATFSQPPEYSSAQSSEHRVSTRSSVSTRSEVRLSTTPSQNIDSSNVHTAQSSDLHAAQYSNINFENGVKGNKIDKNNASDLVKIRSYTILNTSTMVKPEPVEPTLDLASFFRVGINPDIPLVKAEIQPTTNVEFHVKKEPEIDPIKTEIIKPEPTYIEREPEIQQDLMIVKREIQSENFELNLVRSSRDCENNELDNLKMEQDNEPNTIETEPVEELIETESMSEDNELTVIKTETEEEGEGDLNQLTINSLTSAIKEYYESDEFKEAEARGKKICLHTYQDENGQWKIEEVPNNNLPDTTVLRPESRALQHALDRECRRQVPTQTSTAGSGQQGLVDHDVTSSSPTVNVFECEQKALSHSNTFSIGNKCQVLPEIPTASALQLKQEFQTESVTCVSEHRKQFLTQAAAPNSKCRQQILIDHTQTGSETATASVVECRQQFFTKPAASSSECRQQVLGDSSPPTSATGTKTSVFECRQQFLTKPAVPNSECRQKVLIDPSPTTSATGSITPVFECRQQLLPETTVPNSECRQQDLLGNALTTSSAADIATPIFKCRGQYLTEPAAYNSEHKKPISIGHTATTLASATVPLTTPPVNANVPSSLPNLSCGIPQQNEGNFSQSFLQPENQGFTLQPPQTLLPSSQIYYLVNPSTGETSVVQMQRIASAMGSQYIPVQAPQLQQNQLRVVPLNLLQQKSSVPCEENQQNSLVTSSSSIPCNTTDVAKVKNEVLQKIPVSLSETKHLSPSNAFLDSADKVVTPSPNSACSSFPNVSANIKDKARNTCSLSSRISGKLEDKSCEIEILYDDSSSSEHSHFSVMSSNSVSCSSHSSISGVPISEYTVCDIKVTAREIPAELPRSPVRNFVSPFSSNQTELKRMASSHINATPIMSSCVSITKLDVKGEVIDISEDDIIEIDEDIVMNEKTIPITGSEMVNKPANVNGIPITGSEMINKPANVNGNTNLKSSKDIEINEDNDIIEVEDNDIIEIENNITEGNKDSSIIDKTKNNCVIEIEDTVESDNDENVCEISDDSDESVEFIAESENVIRKPLTSAVTPATNTSSCSNVLSSANFVQTHRQLPNKNVIQNVINSSGIPTSAITSNKSSISLSGQQYHCVSTPSSVTNTLGSYGSSASSSGIQTSPRMKFSTVHSNSSEIRTLPNLQKPLQTPPSKIKSLPAQSSPSGRLKALHLTPSPTSKTPPAKVRSRAAQSNSSGMLKIPFQTSPSDFKTRTVTPVSSQPKVIRPHMSSRSRVAEIAPRIQTPPQRAQSSLPNRSSQTPYMQQAQSNHNFSVTSTPRSTTASRNLFSSPSVGNTSTNHNPTSVPQIGQNIPGRAPLSSTRGRKPNTVRVPNIKSRGSKSFVSPSVTGRSKKDVLSVRLTTYSRPRGRPSTNAHKQSTSSSTRSKIITKVDSSGGVHHVVQVRPGMTINLTPQQIKSLAEEHGGMLPQYL